MPSPGVKATSFRPPLNVVVVDLSPAHNVTEFPPVGLFLLPLQFFEHMNRYSLGLTFLSRPHFDIANRYCRGLRREE